jgi:hypothetical protein
MKFDNATKFNRKSGVAQWRDLRCASRPSRILRGCARRFVSMPKLDKSGFQTSHRDFVEQKRSFVAVTSNACWAFSIGPKAQGLESALVGLHCSN